MRQRGTLGLLYVMQQCTRRCDGFIHALAAETSEVFSAKLFGQHFSCRATIELPIGQAFDRCVGNGRGKTFRHNQLGWLQAFHFRSQCAR